MNPDLDLERRVEQLAEAMWSRAAAVDQGGQLPVASFAALAKLGLYGMAVDRRQGGLGLDPAEIRYVLRVLGSGCGVTAFAFAQHHGTAAAVASTSNETLRDRWVPKLVKRSLAGIAYAHVRRQGKPVLVAKPDGNGWQLNGTAPWVTSWGLAEVFAVAANTRDGRLLWALLPATERLGMSVARRFDLMVYNATQTVALEFDRFDVDRAQVISVGEFKRWSRRDRLLAARPNPLCLGVGDRALSLLADVSPGMADELGQWWRNIADQGEERCALVDKLPSDVDDDTLEAAVVEVAAARAECLMAVQRICTALLAASGGAAMERSHPAQRLSREALFYVIQAQSGDGRAATLQHLTVPERP